MWNVASFVIAHIHNQKRINAYRSVVNSLPATRIKKQGHSTETRPPSTLGMITC